MQQENDMRIAVVAVYSSLTARKSQPTSSMRCRFSKNVVTSAYPVLLQRQQARRVAELPEVRGRPRRVRLQQRHHRLAVRSKLSSALHGTWEIRHSM